MNDQSGVGHATQGVTQNGGKAAEAGKGRKPRGGRGGRGGKSAQSGRKRKEINGSKPYQSKRPKPSLVKGISRKEAEISPQQDVRLARSWKGAFSKDIPDIMYGCGDTTTTPVPETLEALESIAVEFVRDIVTQAMLINNKGKVDVQDISFVLRKDPRKADRAIEMIDIKEQTKVFKRAEGVAHPEDEIKGMLDLQSANAEMPAWPGA